MQYCKQLLQAEAEARSLNCKLEWLREQALAELEQADTAYLNMGEHGTIIVKPVQLRKSVKSEQEQELESAIAAERAEMVSANKQAIYQHEKQLFMSRLAIDLLSTNSFVEQMTEKLTEVASKNKQATQVQAVSVKLPKPNVHAVLSPKQRQQVYAWGDRLTKDSGFKIAKHALDLFMEHFVLGRYGQQSLEQAWEQRVQWHNKFWGISNEKPMEAA